MAVVCRQRLTILPAHPAIRLLLACLPALQGYAAEQDKRRLQAEVDKLTKRR